MQSQGIFLARVVRMLTLQDGTPAGWFLYPLDSETSCGFCLIQLSTIVTTMLLFGLMCSSSHSMKCHVLAMVIWYLRSMSLECPHSYIGE